MQLKSRLFVRSWEMIMLPVPTAVFFKRRKVNGRGPELGPESLKACCGEDAISLFR